MDKTVQVPSFDSQAERIELTRLFRANGESHQSARGAVLERLAKLVKDARDTARKQLDFDGNGRACAERLADFQDQLIELIHDYTVAHVYYASDPGADRVTVIATGGYGRGLLAPGSDIDLLFLLPAKQTPWGESVVESMLYMLWDLRFKVGHATRNVEQSLKWAQTDMTIRTALLDARLLFGDPGLFQSLQTRFRGEVVANSARAFIDAKMGERDDRHKRTGESRYKVEPNIKDGKGGLRDLHTLHWLATYIHGPDATSANSAAGIFTASEARTFRRSEDFLWTIRCHLHFLTNRAEERLSFDHQPQMAARLGYVDRSGLKAVERFMKHYFLTAKSVGDLTTTLCAALEVQQLKTTPTLVQRLNPLTWRARRQVRSKTEFRVDNGRINVADREVFARDPVNIIRYFKQAEETGAFLHPEALRLISSSQRLIDDRLREDPEANRIFLDLLTSNMNPEATLRRMNEADVLGRFVPEFGRVVAMMQFNMYHHYTVDEHLLRTVGELTRIEEGAVAKDLPLSTRLIKTIQSRRVLFAAAFLHDVGKGSEEDHSILGEKMARNLCPRLGLDAAETETVAWLIREHLTMSTMAQSRDLGDPKTIRAFADVVQSPERLKLLLLLTVADIRAVGPNVWNGWKGQLLRTLYHETEPLVSGGVTLTGTRQRVAAAEAAFLAAVDTDPTVAGPTFIARQYPDYWLKTDTDKQIQHARLVTRADAAGEPLATDVTTDAFKGISELTILAPNHPRLLALFAGACAAAGANIVGAHISTTRDSFALDTFLLERSQDRTDEDELRRANRIGDTIKKLLRGEGRLANLLAKKTQAGLAAQTFTVVPEVLIDNSLSEQFTVIQVSGLDRPGLLYDLTSAISDLNLDITSAHITTFGEKAVDVFYVTDLTNKKIVSPAREKTIRERLAGVLSPPAT
jgi:[protein-PII] uridylyltransferase